MNDDTDFNQLALQSLILYLTRHAEHRKKTHSSSVHFFDREQAVRLLDPKLYLLMRHKQQAEEALDQYLLDKAARKKIGYSDENALRCPLFDSQPERDGRVSLLDQFANDGSDRSQNLNRFLACGEGRKGHCPSFAHFAQCRNAENLVAGERAPAGDADWY